MTQQSTRDDIPIELSTAAEKVLVGGKELPYTSLRESFASYTQDSWTYDGRLAYSSAGNQSKCRYYALQGMMYIIYKHLPSHGMH